MANPSNNSKLSIATIKEFFYSLPDKIYKYVPYLVEDISINARRIFDRIKRNKYVRLGVVLFIVSFLCFAFTYFTNMFTIPMGGDYVLQIIPFAFNAYDDWHTFINTGTFPLWDTSGMLGVNNIGAFSFYSLFSPWTMIYLLFPRSVIPQVQGILTMFKITTAGLLFYGYLGSIKLQESTRRIGAIAFAFCGYIFYNLWFHFIDAICFLPLLLWGIERVLQRKGPFTLILALLLIGLTNYFFLICFCISSMVYVFFRVFQTWKERTFKQTCIIFVEGVSAYAIGILLVAAILLPSLLVGLDIGSTRFGTNYFLQLKNAKDALALMKLLFVFPTDYEVAYPLSSFFFLNYNCFSSNLYRPIWYNNTMSSIFVFTPMTLMLVPSIMDACVNKKWSHLIGVVGVTFFLFTPFAYYAFFGGSALYGRWEIMAVCWILVFLLVHFERRKEIPKYFLDIGLVFNIVMMVFTYFLSDAIQSTHTDIFAPKDGRNWGVIYQIIYSVVCYLVMRFNFKKKNLPNYVFVLIALEAVIQGNATIVGQGVQRFQDLAGGITNVNQETEIVSALNDYDKDFFRIFDSSTDRGANNNQMRVGYNGISTFNTNYATSLQDLLQWSRINYNNSWSMSVNEKRYNLDTLLGVKYYLLKANDTNVPLGFVDVLDIEDNTDEEFIKLKSVLENHKNDHRLYINTNYVDTFFTYDTLVSGGNMSYGYANENSNETVYLKYGILDSEVVSDLRENDKETYNRLSGTTDTLAASYSFINSAHRTLNIAGYNMQLRIPDWNDDGSLNGWVDGQHAYDDISTDDVKTGWDMTYVENTYGYMPYYTRLVMNPIAPVCGNANPDDPNSGCYVSVNAKFGFSMTFFLFDKDGNEITHDMHYYNGYDGRYDWKYARGFYVDRPVHKIIGLVEQDVHPGQNSTLLSTFPQPTINFSYYSTYLADTSRLNAENEHYSITYRDSNTLNFTTNFTEDKLHYTVINTPYDKGWKLTRTLSKNGQQVTEDVNMYPSQGGLIGFEAINSDSENETISYSLTYYPEGLSSGIKFTIIGMILFYGISMLYMGIHLNDKFFNYRYLNLRTHWYDKKIWEKDNKIKRKYRR